MDVECVQLVMKACEHLTDVVEAIVPRDDAHLPANTHRLAPHAVTSTMLPLERWTVSLARRKNHDAFGGFPPNGQIRVNIRED